MPERDKHDYASGITRFGEPTVRGTAARFRCARCGDLAGVVRVVRAGTPVDMGPPLGRQVEERDGLVLDFFLGTAWHSVTSDKLDAVQSLIEEGKVDPAAIRELDWTLLELTPFYCPDCGLNYCPATGKPTSCSMRVSTTAPRAGARKVTSTCSTTDRER